MFFFRGKIKKVFCLQPSRNSKKLYLWKMIQEEFKFYKPCKLLQPYVRYYWVFKSNQLLNTFTFPYWLPSNHLSQAITAVHSRTERYTRQIDYQWSSKFLVALVC